MVSERLANLVQRAERLGVHGLLFQHVALCPTRVWLHHRRIDCAHLNRFMRMGLWLERTSYEGHWEQTGGLGIRPDQVEWNAHIVSEVKSSRGPTRAAKLQLLFYVAQLEVATGERWTGLLRFPRTRRVQRVELDSRWEDELEEALRQIEAIVRAAIPPPKQARPICVGCSYRMLCWGASTEDEG